MRTNSTRITTVECPSMQISLTVLRICDRLNININITVNLTSYSVGVGENVLITL